MEASAPEAPAFTLRYRATVGEARQQAYLAAGRNTWRRTWAILLGPILVGAIMLFFVVSGPSSTGVQLIGAFIAIWSGFGLWVVFAPWSKSEAMRRWYADETATSPYDEGIQSSTRFGSSSVQWEAVTDIRENADAVLFMRRGVVLRWLPGSAFESPIQRQQVLDFARVQMAAHPAIVDD